MRFMILPVSYEKLIFQNFRFAPLMYWKQRYRIYDKMPQSTFDEIVEKYV